MKRINVKFILYVLGTLLLIESGLMMCPLMIALISGEQGSLPILVSSVIAAITGGSFRFFTRKCTRGIERREGYIIVSMVWVLFALFGALPYMLSGYVPNWTDAFFEAVSGFTTTGSTILADIEVLPDWLIFWRAFTHFIGGIGILVLCIAVLPAFGTGSMMLYHAETSGASTNNRLSPRIKDTAKHIARIYFVLNAVCFLFYLPDMGWFDAVCHAFSTTASGGFSTKNASLGAFSPYAQYVTIPFMLLAGSNFILIFHAWKKDFQKIRCNDEFRFYLIIISVASLFCAVMLLLNHYGMEKSIREGLFHVISITTTTGYAVSDYISWPAPLWFILFLLTFIGGCAGSTSGGLKVARFLLFFRMIPVQFKKIVHQNAIIQVKLNRQNFPEERMFRTLAFFMIFICVYTIGVLLLMIFGMDFVSALGASIASLGNSGPGLGSVGPASTYSEVSTMGKWICSCLMILGRLELYSFLVLLSPAFWKSK